MYVFISVIILYVTIIYYKFLNTCFTQKGYYWYKAPSEEFPNSYEELCNVIQAMKQRTKKDILLFKVTDESVVKAFIPILGKLGHTEEELETIITSVNPLIISYKNHHNRIRPYQLISSSRILESKTAHTPSYPAGHAYQAWLLYKKFSELYPHLKSELYEKAEMCDWVRIAAGLHFPSDGVYAKKLLDIE